jgi:ABC-2 type transport system ATP-binding protein
MYVLKTHPSVKNSKNEEGIVLFYLKDKLEAKELNQFLFEHNIVLSHLVKRKNSLEEQFLELTKNK